MLKSGRIRILAIVAFGLGLVFPPDWVLCVEPTGEVRVESAGVDCCDDDPAPAPERALAPGGTGDCDGCQDVPVLLSAVRTNWSAGLDAAPAAIVPARPWSSLITRPVRHRGTTHASASARATLSTTILRR